MEERNSTGILEEFRLEFVECWQRLPNKMLFGLLLLAWLGLFHFYGNSTLGYVRTPSLPGWMYNAYSQKESTDAHGMLVPFLVLVLLWFKRKDLVRSGLRLWAPGLALVVAGLLLHVLGYLVQQPRLSIIGMFVGLFGLMGLAWGPVWLRKSLFPYFLVFFMIPLGTLALPITFRLQMLVCVIVEQICGNLLGLEIIRQGTALFAPDHRFQYEVAAACSGIRSLFATLAVALVYGWLCFSTPWKRLLFLVSAFPLAVLGNVVRMLAIILAAQFGGQEAGNAVHDGGPGGIWSLLPYVPAFGGLILLEYWLREPAGAAPQKERPHE